MGQMDSGNRKVLGDWDVSGDCRFGRVGRVGMASVLFACLGGAGWRLDRHLRAGMFQYLVPTSSSGASRQTAVVGTVFLLGLSALRFCFFGSSWLVFALVVRLAFPASAETGVVISHLCRHVETLGHRFVGLSRS